MGDERKDTSIEHFAQGKAATILVDVLHLTGIVSKHFRVVIESDSIDQHQCREQIEILGIFLQHTDYLLVALAVDGRTHDKFHHTFFYRIETDILIQIVGLGRQLAIDLFFEFLRKDGFRHGLCQLQSDTSGNQGRILIEAMQFGQSVRQEFDKRTFYLHAEGLAIVALGRQDDVLLVGHSMSIEAVKPFGFLLALVHIHFLAHTRQLGKQRSR